MSRQKILEAAFQLFCDGNYNSVSLENIAEKVGIKKPSIYAHFQSKEQLFLQILDREIDRIAVYIEENMMYKPLDTSEAALYDYLIASLEFIDKNTMSARFFNRILNSPPSNLINEISIKFDYIYNITTVIKVDILKNSILKKHIKTLPLEKLLYSFNSLLIGNIAMAMREERLEVEKINFTWKLYWNSIKK